MKTKKKTKKMIKMSKYLEPILDTKRGVEVLNIEAIKMTNRYITFLIYNKDQSFKRQFKFDIQKLFFHEDDDRFTNTFHITTHHSHYIIDFHISAESNLYDNHDFLCLAFRIFDARFTSHDGRPSQDAILTPIFNWSFDTLFSLFIVSSRFSSFTNFPPSLRTLFIRSFGLPFNR